MTSQDVWREADILAGGLFGLFGFFAVAYLVWTLIVSAVSLFTGSQPVTIYPVNCAGRVVRLENRCLGTIVGRREAIRFNADAQTQRVRELRTDTGVIFSPQECDVFDQANWRCSTRSAGSSSLEIAEMQGGQLKRHTIGEDGVTEGSTEIYVSYWRWKLADVKRAP